MNKAFQLKDLLTSFDLSIHEIGNASWWKEVSRVGAPFMKTQENGDCLVLFLWRDFEGDEKQSNTDNVILNVSALTSHNSWEPVYLNRHKGSNVWFGTLIIDIKWRGSYSFIPINVNQDPDLVKHKTDGGREAQRCWWLEVVKNQTHDPLNASPTIASGWGNSSPLHLPNATKELGWKEWDQGKLKLLLPENLKRIDWHSELLNKHRQCVLFSTTKVNAPLVILLDGQKWGADTGALSVLQHLTDINEISPAHYLLIPSIDSETRWQELSCYRPFWLAIIEELLPQVKEYLGKPEKRFTDYIVAGQSLGGLTALYAGMQFPEYFSKVISLSGSFWWPEIERMQDANAFKLANPTWESIAPKNSLAEQLLNNFASVSELTVYQTVGIAEKDLCVYNDLHYQALLQKGANISYHKVNGGHDWLSWRSELINGLIKLIPGVV